MKWLKRLLLGFEGLVLLAVLAAMAGAWWLLGTEDGLHWLIARIPPDAGLRIEGARGSLARGIAFDRLVVEAEDLRVEAKDVRAAGNVFALVAGRVSLSELRASRIAIEISGADKPLVPPQRLALPLGVRVAHAEVPLLAIVNKEARLEFRDVAVSSYAAGPFGHRVRSLSASTPWGEAAVNGEIAGTAPFALSVAGALSMQTKQGPVAAGVQLGGQLDRIRADATGSVQGIAVRGRAELTPFRSLRIVSAEAQLDPVDIARFGADLPHTALEVRVTARESEPLRLSGSIAAANQIPGPLDRGRLPLVSVSSRFSGSMDELSLENLSAVTAGGTLAGRGGLQRGKPGGELQGELQVKASGLDLRALASNLRSTTLQGTLQLAWNRQGQSLVAELEQSGFRVSFDALRQGDVVELKSVRAEADGGTARGSGRIELGRRMAFRARVNFDDLDPSRFGDYPAGALSGTANAEGELREPRRLVAQWSIDRSRLLGRPFSSKGAGTLQGERLVQLDALARYGGGQALLRGSFGGAGDEMRVSFEAAKLAELYAAVSGSARADGRLTGNWANPVLALTAHADALRLPGELIAGTVDVNAALGHSLAAPFEFRVSARKLNARGLALEQLQLQSAGIVSAHEARISARGKGFEFDATARGGWDETRGWTGQITALRNRGTYPLALALPAPFEASARRARLGHLEASLGEGRLTVRSAEWEPGRLASSGEFRGLPAQWLVWAADIAKRVESTLLLDGAWSVATKERLEGTFSVQRASGDLRLAGTAPIALGLQKLAVQGRFDHGRLTAAVDVASRLGDISGEGSLAPTEGEPGLGFDSRSAAAFRVNFKLADVQPLANLYVTQAQIGGSASASLGVSGTLGEPKVSGAFGLDDMSVAMPPYGIYLQGGRLRALLEGDSLTIVELRLHSGEGYLVAGGSVPLHATQGGVDLAWQARDFRLLERPDMRVVVSGDGAVRIGRAKPHAGKLVVTGQLRANQGNFDLGQDGLQKLGDDVVVVGRARANAQSMKVPIALDMTLDLGDQLSVTGHGFDGKIGGQLRLATDESGEPLAYGKLVAVNATFEAYGQRLQVDPGTLVFDGPIRNPALQVTAWRRNQAVEAGVQLSGTVRNPQVTLVSNPAAPEGEKLSWLVLGRAPGEASRGDLGLLQTAASALFVRGNSVPATTRLARAFGFDELAFRGGSELSGRVVALGKRLSDRLYVTYEQGLGTVASNLVKLDYALMQRVSVRAETGTSSGLGLFYRYSWD